MAEEAMTEAQVSQLRETERRERELAEAQDKYRKQLRATAKRLRGEVIETVEVFDRELRELRRQRNKVLMAVHTQEYYCTRMQLSILEHQQDQEYFQDRKIQMLDAAKKENALNNELQRTIKNVRTAESRLHDISQKARDGAHALTSRLGSFTGLPQLKLHRGGIRTGGTRKEIRMTEDDDLDLVASLERNRQEMSRAERQATELLESVDFEGRDVPVDLVKNRFRLEAEHVIHERRLQRLNAQHQLQQMQCDKASAAARRAQTALSGQAVQQASKAVDVELLLRLKQGMVEIPQQAVVTDTSDAVLLPVSSVGKRNHRIRELGQSKLACLSHIKEFRRKLVVLEWEQKLLAGISEDYAQRARDVHVLRVTKELQHLLTSRQHNSNSSNSNNSNSGGVGGGRCNESGVMMVRGGDVVKSRGGEEVAAEKDGELLLEKRMELSQDVFSHRLKAMKQEMRLLQKQKHAKVIENSMLESRLGDLRINVAQREHIRRLRESSSSSSSSADPSASPPSYRAAGPGRGGVAAGRGVAGRGVAGRGVAGRGGGGGVVGSSPNHASSSGSPVGGGGDAGWWTSFRELQSRAELTALAKRHEKEVAALQEELDRLRKKTFPSFGHQQNSSS
eukprot:GHVS01079935.1.p1 GENE.GHVS01079935.1~~GHVS01079935.1.p1  ORF type:complete len:622 (+),score=170.06 GHVS01079935.1:1-1866(+)